MTKAPALVTTQWLKSHMEDQNVVIIDATWYSAASDQDAAMEFKDGHIPGAVFFDIPEISDQSTSLPNMLPPADQFERQVSALGISNSDHVIAYDSIGIFSAARAWWMFRYFGHDNVSVLDGGFPLWLGQNLPTQSGPGKPKKQGQFIAKPRPELVRDYDFMKKNVEQKSAQIYDFRSKERFDGVTPEPFANLKSGHIPNSKNWFYKNLLQADSRMKGAEELKLDIARMGVALDKPLVATCGSAISACIGALALYTVGKEDVAVYDGSWAEWGQKQQSVK